MALPPKETIKPKLQGRYFKIDTYKKPIAVWGLAFLFIVEFSSYIFWDNQNYKDFLYPLLNQTAILILLINILCWYDILKFCNFKIFGLMALILYYIVGIISMIFKIEIIVNIADYFFLPMAFLLFVFSIFKK